MAHELPPLSYDHNALEPHIDARTMEIHHGKHHNAYVSKLNAALENNAEWAAKSIDQLCREVADAPDAIRGALINNGGGHYNHSLFWQIMTPGGATAPSGPLADAINSELGGLDSFKDTFANAAATRFGSGWAWLGVKSGGELCVCSTPNQNNPVMAGLETCPPCTPILGLDVWEHAYYLNYQNRRPDYVAAWWNVVNWDKVGELYAAAKG